MSISESAAAPTSRGIPSQLATNRRPPTADTQCRFFLRLLRERGDGGVSSSELLFEHHIMRPGSRAYDLRAMGFCIESRPGPGGTAIYVLRGEPAELKSLPSYRERPREHQWLLFREVCR